MPFVVRDARGRIAEIHSARSRRAREEVPAQNSDLRRFLETAGGAEVQDALSETDQGLIRVFEDLVAALIDKRIIALTDLPEPAQRKLALRYSLRDRLSDLQGIVGETDELLLP